MSRWLLALPSPVAVYTVDAHRGRQLAEICYHSGIRVPDTVAILAGDTDELIETFDLDIGLFHDTFVHGTLLNGAGTRDFEIGKLTGAELTDPGDRWASSSIIEFLKGIFEVAAMLCQIGCIALPPDTLNRVYARQAVSKAEQKMLDEHPRVGHELLCRIPRMEAVAAMVDFLLSQQLNGLYVCGSTGEGMSLSTTERKAVTREYCQAVNKKVPVIAQVGHNCLSEACELARDAQQAGVDVISATCPSYFKIDNVDLLIDCMAPIAAAAPELPFYYYHIPALTGSQIDMVEFLQKGSARIPNLVGLKYTATALHEYQQA